MSQDEFFPEAGWERVSARERRAADLFFDDWVGEPRRRIARHRESFETPIDETYELPAGEARPTTTPPLTVAPYLTLDRIVFRDEDFLPSHRAGITRVAHLVADSQGSSEAITTVWLVGHTDSKGRGSFNRTLGTNRANKVKAFLATELDRFQSGLSSSVTIVVDSEGESKPVASNSTADGRARNRRVEIFVPTTCQAFFALYDLSTLPGSTSFGVPANPSLTAAERVLREADVGSFVTGANPLLIDRRNARATAATSGSSGTVPAAATVPSSHQPQTQRLSDLQLGLFREFMPNGSGGIEFDRARTCFEGFANGDLRSSINASIAEPNGGFFFLFAEWAFLCVDSSIDVSDWTNLLRIFVMTQEMFIRVYRPPAASSSPPRALNSFHFSNFTASGQFTAPQKATLRTRYAAMNLAALRTAARDNLRLAITMP